MSANAISVGGTGLTGGSMLKAALVHPFFGTVSAFTRKPLSVNDPHDRLRTIQEPDSTKWPSGFKSVSPAPDVFFSGLGITRAEAGGVPNQRKIEVGLNLELARAAKEAGVRVYVVITGAGANKDSSLALANMKGELEEAVGKLGFEKAIFVRPGLICGPRPDNKYGINAILSGAANFMGRVSGNYLKDFWAQDGEVIGRAAVSAAVKALDKSAPEGNTWILTMADIVRLGRTEWNVPEPPSQ